MTARSGIGIDVHPFSDDPARALVLGGVNVAGERGLKGHSDADVVAHALSDAMLGAASLGDIGMHFPDTEERWKGAESLALLAGVAELVRAAGFSLVNADCTLVAERPRIQQMREEMMNKLTRAAGGPVHVKATRPEGLGALGRVEGIACLAVCLLDDAEDRK